METPSYQLLAATPGSMPGNQEEALEIFEREQSYQVARERNRRRATRRAGSLLKDAATQRRGSPAQAPRK